VALKIACFDRHRMTVLIIDTHMRVGADAIDKTAIAWLIMTLTKQGELDRTRTRVEREYRL
jgi:hypothetical protein